jgi:hypothetical protein
MFRLRNHNYSYIQLEAAQIVEWVDRTRQEKRRHCSAAFYRNSGTGLFSIDWSVCEVEKTMEFVSVCASFTESHEHPAERRQNMGSSRSECADFWEEEDAAVVDKIYGGEGVLIHMDVSESPVKLSVKGSLGHDEALSLYEI